MEQNARWLAEQGEGTVLFDLAEGGRLKSRIWAEAIDAGDALAARLVDEAASALAAAIASAIVLIDLELVVLGGGMAERLGEPFRKRVENEVMERSFTGSSTPVRAARMGDTGGAVGPPFLSRTAANGGHRPRSATTPCRCDACWRLGPERHPCSQPRVELACLQRSVLELVADPEVPLLERAAFLAIFSSNLDEFFQVRVSGLHDQVAAGITKTTSDGRLPGQQIEEIREVVSRLSAQHQSSFIDDVRPALHREGIGIVNYTDLDEEQRERTAVQFRQRIFPVLTPLAVDPGIRSLISRTFRSTSQCWSAIRWTTVGSLLASRFPTRSLDGSMLMTSTCLLSR